MWTNEDQFEWRLAVEEDATAEKQAIRGKTVTRKKWRLKASPMQSANILASRLEKTALAILQAGARARN